MGAVAAWAARAVARLAAATALAALLAGVPAGLAFAIGWPLPTSLPTGWAGWQQLLSSPIPDTAILRLLAVAGWLLWAAFTRAVWVEARAAWHGVRAPDRRWLGASPLRATAAFLIAALFAGSIAAGTATASRPAAAATTTGPAPAKPAGMVVAAPATGGLPAPAADRLARAPLLPAGPALLVVDGCGYLYTVAKGDSLWTIAEHCLGDGNRWPQIWQLNKGKFWPAVSGHKRLDDPDLIYPRWTLTLPASATPPAGAPPTEPATPPGTGPGAPGTPAPTPTVASPTTAPPASTDPDGVVAPPPTATAPSATPSPTHTPASPSPVTSSPDDAPPDSVDEHGVRLPDGSWVPWALAGAVTAAMAIVWLQRRRRYLPRPLDGTAADERPADPKPPPVVRAVGRHWRARPGPGDIVEITASPTDEPPRVPPPPAVAVPPVPAIDPLPAGGLGLVGDGAEAAARGALVAALAAGAPTDPDARTEVVIPADTIITLLGADAVAVGTWPRLRVTPDLDAALAALEQRLLHAARLLDDHDVDDVATLRRAAPAEQPLPPMLLVAATPPPGLRVRTRMVLGLGSGVQVTALLLGQWGHGPTVRVDPDGATHPLDAAGGVAGQLPARMAVLEQAAATDLLATMREAHTGEPAPPPHPEPQLAAAAADPPDADTTDASGHPAVGADENEATVAPAGANDEKATMAPHDDDGGPAAAPDGPHPATGEPDPAQPAGPPAPPRVRVLGTAHIVDKPVGELFRSDAVELMVYLAVHADGATPEQIQEDLFPAVRRRPAAGRLHTAASNLRKLLALSVGGDPIHYVVKQRGRYRLHADTVNVDVDLWTLRRAHATARAATGDDRLTALRQACGVYTGELAEGADYEWITRHRKGVADLAIDAHTALAAAIADTDPQQAAQLLQAAADHDPLNEEVCQRSMRAWHRLGDPDAIRALLRRLALALDEIGAEPSQDTIALADQLRRDLERPHRAA